MGFGKGTTSVVPSSANKTRALAPEASTCQNLIQAGPNLSAGVKILELNPIRRECIAAGSFLVGTWLSLVEHSLGVRGVGSSNLPVPTISLHVLLS
jgi:hypothetical protein